MVRAIIGLVRARAALIAALALLVPSVANATCPTFHTLSNGTTADATQVMDNFNYILGCPNFTGNVGIGNSAPGISLLVGPGTHGTIFDGAGSSFTPQIQNAQTSGVAGISAFVNDGTYNKRIGIFADQPNNVVGLSYTYGSAAPTFQIRDATTARFVIGPTGNISVGVADTTPDTPFGVVVTGDTARTWTPATGIVALFDRIGSGTGSAANIDIASGTSGVDRVLFGSPTQEAASVVQWDNGVNAMSFWTGTGGTASQRMTINSGGSVGIGTASPAYPLDVVGDIRTSTCLRYSGGSLGTCTSDARLKRDVRRFVGLGLAQIAALRPVTFYFNGFGGNPDDGRPQVGLVAQEVAKVAPGLVSEMTVKLRQTDKGPTRVAAVDYGKLTYGLINAVRELKQIHDSDTKLIKNLQQRVAVLEHQQAR